MEQLSQWYIIIISTFFAFLIALSFFLMRHLNKPYFDDIEYLKKSAVLRKKMSNSDKEVDLDNGTPAIESHKDIGASMTVRKKEN
jgi:hypothetical protein